MFVRTKQEWISMLNTVEGTVNPSSAEEIYDQGQFLVEMLRTWGIIRAGDRILDLGSGIGRLAIPLTELDVEYVGSDILPTCIAFCHKAFVPWREFHFRFLNAHNPHYTCLSSTPAEEMTLPFQNGSFDVVLAISLFTHLERASACERYLSEIERVLKPGGRLLSTWYCNPPHRLSSSAERTVLPATTIRRLLSRFVITHEWGGQTDAIDNQWLIGAQTRS